MRHLRRIFEFNNNPQEEVSDNIDEIINVLKSYVKIYDDGQINNLFELLWSIPEDYLDGNELDNVEDSGILSDNIIVSMVRYFSESSNKRDISKFLSVYYDCYHAINNSKNSLENYTILKDIFIDFVDDNLAKIYKTSDKYDDRYIVEIKKDNILKNIDFEEIIDKFTNLTNIETFEYSGSEHHITFQFFSKIKNNEDY